MKVLVGEEREISYCLEGMSKKCWRYYAQLILFTIHLSGLCQSCPSGWVHVGDDCFLVSNDTAKLFIFAHRECEKHGSILYQPTSHSEVVHIIGLLNFLKQKTYENFYLGLRRKGNTGGK